MPSEPNIVFILADDLGYGDLSTVNGGLSSTPTLDALMGESIRFTHCYAASPVCNPSRAALMTGRYPHRTGSIDTLEWRGLERLALRETTLADLLRATGYVTGLIGKWHLGSFDPRYHPERRGFDESVCFRGGMHDYYRWRLEYGPDTVRHADGRYLTDVFTEEAVQFIRRHKDERFFLHLTYNAPHTPLQVPEDELSPFVERGEFTRGVSTLYAMIRRMDRGIARVLETLDELGLRENTLLLFASDNGPQFGGQGELCTTRFNCQLHGAKGSVYEGGIRVPALVRWPAGLPGPRDCHAMVHFTDWFATLLAAAGLDVPIASGNQPWRMQVGGRSTRPIDGVNVLPVLRGEGGRTENRRFWQWNRYTPLVTCNAAMRDGDWKLVRPAIREAMQVPDIQYLEVSMYNYDYFVDHGILRGEPEREVPPPPAPELYNLAEDPLEQRNLADLCPERVQALLRALETWFEEVDTERRTIADDV
jgi:arylsulfatase A-like enzyme